MIKYCFIKDEETGLVQLGAGCPDSYYIEIGMEQREVEQSEIDFNWYLSEKCPHYTEEERAILEKQYQINRIKEELNELDLKSIRSIRANETDRIAQYEEQAQELRDELNQLIEDLEE